MLLSPDLALVAGHQARRAPSRGDSCFHLALADTEPDAWGRRVIARVHAKAHKTNPQLRKHSTPDDLSAVDDFSREVGLLAKELDGFMPAFEHAQMDAGGIGCYQGCRAGSRVGMEIQSLRQL